MQSKLGVVFQSLFCRSLQVLKRNKWREIVVFQISPKSFQISRKTSDFSSGRSLNYIVSGIERGQVSTI